MLKNKIKGYAVTKRDDLRQCVVVDESVWVRSDSEFEALDPPR